MVSRNLRENMHLGEGLTAMLCLAADESVAFAVADTVTSQVKELVKDLVDEVYDRALRAEVL